MHGKAANTGSVGLRNHGRRGINVAKYLTRRASSCRKRHKYCRGPSTTINRHTRSLLFFLPSTRVRFATMHRNIHLVALAVALLMLLVPDSSAAPLLDKRNPQGRVGRPAVLPPTRPNPGRIGPGSIRPGPSRPGSPSLPGKGATPPGRKPGSPISPAAPGSGRKTPPVPGSALRLERSGAIRRPPQMGSGQTPPVPGSKGQALAVPGSGNSPLAGNKQTPPVPGSGKSPLTGSKQTPPVPGSGGNTASDSPARSPGRVEPTNPQNQPFDRNKHGFKPGQVLHGHLTSNAGKPAPGANSDWRQIKGIPKSSLEANTENAKLYQNSKGMPKGTGSGVDTGSFNPADSRHPLDLDAGSA